MLLGSVEAGGTKFVCAVGNEDFKVQESVTFPTTTPEETLRKTLAFFKKFADLKAIGVSSFGPIEIRKSSPKYGYITNTPKPGWKDTDFVNKLQASFPVPIAWTTDVNGSAYGEYIAYKKAGLQLSSLAYYTVGTGIGAGIVTDGKLVGSEGHPELGHVYLKRHSADLNFKGICPYHGDCLEGLASGPTFKARLGIAGQDVPLTDPTWNIIAYYVAQGVMQATLALRPSKIVIGGGVSSEAFLKKVRLHFKKLLNDYVAVGDLEQYIVTPKVPHNGSAIMGSLALALAEYQKSAQPKATNA
ncbi:ROK family protein [Liquorilactobacillus satsumensis]|uniref:Fructokinase n=1 Tax=Liquorilactobacillus satsumensis DSM 16230 = JCM 12392 TaxID=1423801 RepID=A0A0R1V1B3_9LACO|nr:ROK family protein [Liquorilactobacillus satsumensis]KRL97171.1 fructokinase [Liquorilactobacillus satsumensis DSM 16230 = JCM 12392]MCP9328596.1 ROK family protein [Liquorilactobacillus satsumensis]